MFMSDFENTGFDNSRYQFSWENFHFDPDYIDIDCLLRFHYKTPGSMEEKCWSVKILAYDSKSLTFSAVESSSSRIIYFNIRRVIAGSVVDRQANRPIASFTGQYFKDIARSNAYNCRPRKAAPVAPSSRPVIVPPKPVITPPAVAVQRPSPVTVLKTDLDIRILFFSGAYNKISVAMRVDALCKDLHSGAFFLTGINEKSAQKITLKNTMVSDGIYHRKQRYDWSEFIYLLSSGQLPVKEATEIALNKPAPAPPPRFAEPLPAPEEPALQSGPELISDASPPGEKAQTVDEQPVSAPDNVDKLVPNASPTSRKRRSLSERLTRWIPWRWRVK